MIAAVRHRIYEILEVVRENDTIARYFQVFLIVLIVLNVLAVIMESVRTLLLQYFTVFLIFEIFSVAVFTIEYILRLWVCTEKPEFRRPFLGRLRYALTPVAIIDLVAVIPFYLPLLVPVDLRFLRILRLTRLFRALKLVRYSDAFDFLSRALKREKYVIIIILLILTVMFIFASALMYHAEHDAQPDAFASIPHAMWWAIVTLTTVGYGDILPITVQGKVLGAIIAVIGIGMFALPAGVIAAGFIEEIKSSKNAGCGPDPDARISSLERLAALKEQGYLSDDEYEREKQRVLDS